MLLPPATPSNGITFFHYVTISPDHGNNIEALVRPTAAAEVFSTSQGGLWSAAPKKSF
jgi:hypothetical protein